MTEQVTTVIQPFVQRGLFESPEKAITEMARDYIWHQIGVFPASCGSWPSPP